MHKCDFCGKDQTQVIRMIVANNVAICNECVILCSEILMEELSEYKELEFKSWIEERKE